MGVRWALHDGEVIDHGLLRALDILAKANRRSVVDELNFAVSDYVEHHLPLKLGKDGLALFLEVMREETA